jgi:putative Mg2+ transporter-C (MgtC) family protein
VWHEIRDVILADFSDLPELTDVVRVAVRLFLAALLGGILGWQREQAGKAAGLRTHMLVALGSALFVLIPQQAGVSSGDMTRVIQGIVTGIGFLGAGSILKLTEPGQIYGLTTAAGIWLTAAVGIAAGLGREASAILATLLAFMILALVPHGESQSQKSDDERGLRKETSPPSSDGYVRTRQSEESVEYDER